VGIMSGQRTSTVPIPAAFTDQVAPRISVAWAWPFFYFSKSLLGAHRTSPVEVRPASLQDLFPIPGHAADGAAS